MIVSSFRIRRFRNIIDSGTVEVQPDVTCLVGKNESGKTAILQALYRLNPAYGEGFEEREHYPRWLLVRDRREGIVGETMPVEVTFKLEDVDREAVENVLGPGVVASELFTYSRKYDGGQVANAQFNEARAVEYLLGRLQVEDSTVGYLSRAKTFDELRQLIEIRRKELQGNAEAEAEDADRDSVLGDLDIVEREVNSLLGDMTLQQVGINLLKKRIPKFFYFTEYSIMPGRIDLDRIDGNDDDGPARSGVQAVRALLRLAGTDTDALRDDNYEERKAELEAVSNDLTRQVFEYWSQNQELQVEIDVDKEIVPSSPPRYGPSPTTVARHLEIRVRDPRHGFTSNFGQRSSGFQWFFSFLAAFSEFEGRDGGVVVLLDEPALALHGKAQDDFLRFINERLAPVAQVIYTTHSPFMVEVGRLERVRVVEDKGPNTGAVVSSEVLSVGGETLFPLQAALGYDIAQSLFVGPANLVIEGTSDFTYLTTISDYLHGQNRIGLDSRWRLLPAGSASNIPAMVALVGRALEVTVLADSGTGGAQRLQHLASSGLLDQSRLFFVGQTIGASRADIEDLFAPEDYLQLYNGAFGTNLRVSDLQPGDRIIDRISRTTGQAFTDHGKPADYLLRNRDQLLPRFTPTTLDNFERLFEMINSTLSAV